MAGKKIPTGTPGMYGRIGTKQIGGKPVTTYYGRVYVKAEGRTRYFRLGTGLKASERKYHALLGDPGAALLEREAKPVQRIAFDALVKLFLGGYRSRGESGYYGHVSQSWIEYFGKAEAGSITRARVESYRDHLRRECYGDSTIRKYVGALGTMYRWAIGRGLVTMNPAEGVKRPSEPNREVAVLSRDEETDLLAKADPQTRPVVDLCIASGMRRGEALDLRWSQIDRHGAAILIHKSKTGKGRSIPLNARLTAILDRATRHVRSDHVLAGREGQPLDPFVITRAVESAFDAAGITKHAGAVFNLFRHTFGSRLAEAGHSMATIACIMGNSPAICERHYIRFSPGHLRAAMASLDGAQVAGKGGAQDGARPGESVNSGASESLQVVEL
jgi:integrase